MGVIRVIDPVTRLEGHLKVEITIDTVNGRQQVVDARATGTLFRGFEKILQGRDPKDAPHITQRICGVCPVSHGMASVLALDQAGGVTVPANARILRNLILGANFVQSHILHFYHLAAQDFVDGPAMPPWQPSWAADKRLDAATSEVVVNHYVTALDMRRKAHEMGAIFGGRMPHPPSFIPGGVTCTPRADRIQAFQNYLDELIPFITDTYIPDVELIASVYDDYWEIGRGAGNLLAYGVFDLNDSGTSKLLGRGRAVDGSTSVLSVDTAAITEKVSHSWYADADDNLNPAAGETAAVFPKGGAYSWLKAPRYSGLAYETGPLARMWVNGDYQGGISVLDRHLARALETLKVAQAMQIWLNELSGTQVYTTWNTNASGQGIGLTEAPRGALGHWVVMSGGRLSHYQVITPTCWNASPRDDNSVLGPMEQALLGTPVGDVDEPVEVVRVIHSYDPCLSCAVHVMRPAERARIITLNPGNGATSCRVAE
jgi:hydrogenase large subunit